LRRDSSTEIKRNYLYYLSDLFPLMMMIMTTTTTTTMMVMMMMMCIVAGTAEKFVLHTSPILYATVYIICANGT